MNAPSSLLGQDKLNFLLNQLHDTELVEGDIIEAGVYKGGSLYAMTQYVGSWSPKNIFGYDTFEGLPNSESTTLVEGRFKSSFEDTVKLFSDSGFKNIKILKGYFPDTCLNELVSFAHLDMDLYIPTIKSLNHLSTIMNVNGIILLDDYKFPETPGIEKAVSYFLNDNNKFEIKAFNKYQIALQRIK